MTEPAPVVGLGGGRKRNDSSRIEGELGAGAAEQQAQQQRQHGDGQMLQSEQRKRCIQWQLRQRQVPLEQRRVLRLEVVCFGRPGHGHGTADTVDCRLGRLEQQVFARKEQSSVCTARRIRALEQHFPADSLTHFAAKHLEDQLGALGVDCSMCAEKRDLAVLLQQSVSQWQAAEDQKDEEEESSTRKRKQQLLQQYYQDYHIKHQHVRQQLHQKQEREKQCLERRQRPRCGPEAGAASNGAPTPPPPPPLLQQQAQMQQQGPELTMEQHMRNMQQQIEQQAQQVQQVRQHRECQPPPTALPLALDAVTPPSPTLTALPPPGGFQSPHKQLSLPRLPHTPQPHTPQQHTPQQHTPQQHTPQQHTPQHTPQQQTPQQQSCVADTDPARLVMVRNLIVFDWDDTILPSYVILHSNLRPDLPLPPDVRRQLTLLGQQAAQLLEAATAFGDVCIITNAGEGWVEASAKTFLPEVLSVLQSVEVISARTKYEHMYPTSTVMWKLMAFRNKIASHVEAVQGGGASGEAGGAAQVVQETRHPTCVTSFGDSTDERAALWYHVRNQSQPGAEAIFGKVVKFMHAPSILQLHQQIEYVRSILDRMFNYAGHLDLVLSDQNLPG